VQELQAALLALSRPEAADETQQLAQSCLHLIAAREAMLPIGTPHLAALYATHGAALCRVLRDADTLSASERAAVASAAARSLGASHRIRACCLGEEHPLAKATRSAAEHAREALR